MLTSRIQAGRIFQPTIGKGIENAAKLEEVPGTRAWEIEV
jgi:hypothetical protein